MGTTTKHQSSARLIRWVTVSLFFVFAMTTDSVGVIIPQVVQQFQLSLKAAAAFHYAPMIAIAVAAVALGTVADRRGRKFAIVSGLTLFAASGYLMVLGRSFGYFLFCLAVSGVAIGVFKTGALAVIGDISASAVEHTATMNLAEGFFGCGGIVGPAIVAWLIDRQIPWQWLYAVAASICVILIGITAKLRYPGITATTRQPVRLSAAWHMLKDPYAMGFACAAFLYVCVEAAVYVWGPTYLGSYRGRFALLATYVVTVFFVLRALGRFLGVWLVARCDWSLVLLACGVAVCSCLLGSALGGPQMAVWLLPGSGLFMSIIYPTLNSKCISGFPRREHGAVSGLILFFTCVGAVLGPLAMGAIIDALGQAKYAFMLAAGLAAILNFGLFYNWLRTPTRARLERIDEGKYAATSPAP